MFRAALFSAVLSLAVGSSASLVCRAWCSTPDGCHDREAASLAWTGDHDCDDETLNQVAFLKEEVRRSVSVSQARAALAVLSYQFHSGPTSVGLNRSPAPTLSLEKPHIETALRI
jgi:hypothetical protein